MSNIHDPQPLRTHQLLKVLIQQKDGILEAEVDAPLHPEGECACASDDRDGVTHERAAAQRLQRVAQVRAQVEGEEVGDVRDVAERCGDSFRILVLVVCVWQWEGADGEGQGVVWHLQFSSLAD